MTKIVVLGLGSGGLDSMSVGVLRRLRLLQQEGFPLLLRTRRHPGVDELERNEHIEFAASFDHLYETGEQFDEVYRMIAAEVAAAARHWGCAGYVAPGHPLLGESTARLLLLQADEFEIEIVSSGSFVDALLTAAGQECTELDIVDALSIPDVTDPFRTHWPLLNTRRPNVVYQIHDRFAAVRTKLALLEQYPPDFEVVLVRAAGVATLEQVKSTPLHLLDRTSNGFDHLTSLFVPALSAAAPASEFTRLLDIMAQLRNPQTGCPWDREQTPESLKRYIVEEAYEVLDAIDEGDPVKYAEELGDLLLQVAFHAQLARESGEFDIRDVISAITEKLVRRHPHVFGDTTAADAQEVLRNWEVIKRAEPGYETRVSALDGVPLHLPALMKAQEISRRAVRLGFEWPDIDGVFDKLDEELAELQAAIIEDNPRQIESELGDILFTVVNIARFLKVDAEEALRKMTGRFAARFRYMEQHSSAPLKQLDPADWESLWHEAKANETA